jgi:undecaprenyl-diphosphatase
MRLKPSSCCSTPDSAAASAEPAHHASLRQRFWAATSDRHIDVVVGEIATGLWVGGETRFGKTDWQAIDSTAAGAILAQTGKFIFTRSRPSQTDNPNLWFQGKGNYSFPSGEVTTVTSIVTPFILE